jgi:hypothetical protein
MSLDKQSPTPPPTWSPETRSLVSLLIFAHLFALFVGVTTYTRPSDLQLRLHGLFAPYLRNLHFTAHQVSYPVARYYLTHALPTDVDFTCQVDFNTPDGSAQEVTIPRGDLQPLIRARRYQAIANAAGTMADPEANEDLASVLPKALAGAILKQHGAAQGNIRVRAHYIPQIEDMVEVAAGRRTPPINDIYEAKVFVTGNSIELLKKANKLEVAPVQPSAAPPSTLRIPSPPPVKP